MAALLKIPEAAAAIRCSESQVRLMVERGELEAARVGQRSVRIWAESVKRFLVRGYIPPDWPGEVA